MIRTKMNVQMLYNFFKILKIACKAYFCKIKFLLNQRIIVQFSLVISKYNIKLKMLGRQIPKHDKHQQICGKTYQHHKSHDMHLVNWNMDDEKHQNVSSVIISISSGESFAKQFRNFQILSKNKQQKVLVGVAMCFQTQNIRKLLKGQNINIPQYQTLSKYIKKVKSNKVVINWEHSSGFSTGQFLNGKQPSLQIIQICIKNGYTQMFAGYSLMTLLHNWNDHILGIKPFVPVKLPEQRPLELLLDLNELKKVQSDQLNSLSKILTSPICLFIPQNGQFCFGKKTNHHDQKYKLHILSINVSCPSQKQQQNVVLNGVRGSYGHTYLQYKSGARIFCSSGIWTEIEFLHVQIQNIWKDLEERFTKQNYENIIKKYENSQYKQKQMHSIIINLLNSRAPC